MLSRSLKTPESTTSGSLGASPNKISRPTTSNSTQSPSKISRPNTSANSPASRKSSNSLATRRNFPHISPSSRQGGPRSAELLDDDDYDFPSSPMARPSTSQSATPSNLGRRPPSHQGGSPSRPSPHGSHGSRSHHPSPHGGSPGGGGARPNTSHEGVAGSPSRTHGHGRSPDRPKSEGGHYRPFALDNKTKMLSTALHGHAAYRVILQNLMHSADAKQREWEEATGDAPVAPPPVKRMGTGFFESLEKQTLRKLRVQAQEPQGRLRAASKANIRRKKRPDPVVHPSVAVIKPTMIAPSPIKEAVADDSRFEEEADPAYSVDLFEPSVNPSPRPMSKMFTAEDKEVSRYLRMRSTFWDTVRNYEYVQNAIQNPVMANAIKDNWEQEEEELVTEECREGWLKYISECKGLDVAPKPFFVGKPDVPLVKLDHFGTGAPIGNAMCEQFTKTPGIGELHLRENRLDKEGLSALHKVFTDTAHITKLVLAGNNCGPGSAAALAEILSKNMLTELDVSDNRLGDVGAAAVVDSLAKQRSLTMLDLSRNDIGSRGGRMLCSGLMADRTLKSINLSWNAIRRTGAVALAQMLGQNFSLIDINLSWNGFDDEVGMAFATMFTENNMVQVLNLSNNRFRNRSVIVMARALAKNPVLKLLNMDGNPMGQSGAIHLFRVLLRFLPDQYFTGNITVNNCSFNSQAVGDFDREMANRRYVLNLALPYDRVVGWELRDMVVIDKAGLWKNCKLDGQPFTVGDRTFESATKGRLDLEYISVQTSLKPVPDEKFEAILKIIADTSHSELVRATIVRLVSKSFSVTADQAVKLVNNVENKNMRLDCVASLYTCVSDMDNIAVLISGLSPLDRQTLDRILGTLIPFSPTNPTGHYHLDLEKRWHMRIAQSLIEFGFRDKEKRRKPGALKRNEMCGCANCARGDLSQTGNGECWRNETYGGKPFTYMPEWQLPRSGILVLDFVETCRPSTKTVPVSVAKFNTFMKNLASLTELEEKLSACRSLARSEYVKAFQVLRIFKCFPEKDPLLEELAVMFFRRVVDYKEFSSIMQCLSEQSWINVQRRLGYLNLFDTLHPDGAYTIDFSVRDERCFSISLMKLAGQEETEVLFKINFNGTVMTCAATISMCRDAPRKGILLVEYHSQHVDRRNNNNANNDSGDDGERAGGERRGGEALDIPAELLESNT